jgi:hypothetical protein
MELEVGMYVRTKRDIGKVTDVYERIDGNMVCNIAFNTGVYQCYFTEIKEASCCAINLIQVGDYVNGLKIIRTNDDYVFAISDEGDTIMFGNDKQIKSIVTKEQFEQMQYKVGE